MNNTWHWLSPNPYWKKCYLQLRLLANLGDDSIQQKFPGVYKNEISPPQTHITFRRNVRISSSFFYLTPLYAILNERNDSSQIINLPAWSFRLRICLLSLVAFLYLSFQYEYIYYFCFLNELQSSKCFSLVVCVMTSAWYCSCHPWCSSLLSVSYRHFLSLSRFTDLMIIVLLRANKIDLTLFVQV